MMEEHEIPGSRRATRWGSSKFTAGVPRGDARQRVPNSDAGVSDQKA